MQYKNTQNADMENVRNFTQVGFLISRFYPKVHELRQFQNRDKQRNLSAITMHTALISLNNALHNLGCLT